MSPQIRGRGVDFKQRHAMSWWAEDLVLKGLGNCEGLLVTRYGLSEYIEPGIQIEASADVKEPDLLVYDARTLTTEEAALLKSGGVAQNGGEGCGAYEHMAFLVSKALAGIEVEVSPYQAKIMRDRNWKPIASEDFDRRPRKRAEPPIAPNVFVKEEDVPRLARWSECFGECPVVIIHVFDQEAFAVHLRDLQRFWEEWPNDAEQQRKKQLTTGIFYVEQRFDRVDAQGAAETKRVFRVAPAAAILVGDVVGVKVSAQVEVSSSGKYVTQPRFEGGRLVVRDEFLEFLRGLRGDSRRSDNG